METQESTFIGENAGLGDVYCTHNIILGNNANLDNPTDSYMLVLGTWKYKMTPEEYEIIHKAVTEVMKTIYDNKNDNKFVEWVEGLPVTPEHLSGN